MTESRIGRAHTEIRSFGKARAKPAQEHIKTERNRESRVQERTQVFGSAREPTSGLSLGVSKARKLEG